MKKWLVLLVGSLAFSTLSAQYDFPVIINGLSISLDLRGSRVVYPQQWLLGAIGDCRPDSLRISRTVFPRGTTPPPGAADSLEFTCLDFSSESVEIWWKNSQDEWLVTDSYTLIGGFEACGCSDDCGEATRPTLINGLSAGFAADGMLQLSAREFVADLLPDHTYSFTSDPVDSIRTYACPGQVVAVEIFAHAAGLIARSASTYLTIDGQNCEGSPATGAPARVIQGLSVPLNPAGMVSVLARAFASLAGPAQQLAFGPDPTDTLKTISCASLTGGALQLVLYNHATGTAGSPALSYLIADNGRQFCTPSTIPSPANDDRSAAISLDDCERFGQFYRAGTEAEELLPDEAAGGTVWYRFSFLSDGSFRNLRIEAVDSLYLSVYPSSEPSQAYLTTLVLPGDTTLDLCYNDGPPFDQWFVQIQQADTGRITRYYLSSVPEDKCPLATAAVTDDLAGMRLFPNPGRGLYHLSYEGGITELVTLQVYDRAGRLVAQFPPGNSFTLTDVAPGLYFLRVIGREGSRLLRVVHQ